MEYYKNVDQQELAKDKETITALKRWSEPINLPNTQRSMNCNHAELPHKALTTSGPSTSESRIVKQTVVESNPWKTVEQRQRPSKMQRTELSTPMASNKIIDKRPKRIRKQPD